MSHSSWSTQGDYFRRFEWGSSGAERLAETESIVVVVDVLRFTTAVEAVVSRGGLVYPFRWQDASARAFADAFGAQLSDRPDAAGVSLSPRALLNQATLAAVIGAVVVAACLRNAPAVAEYLAATSLPVTVLACGERRPDGTLRPSLEDLLGAGAVLANLDGDLLPEAKCAAAAWRDAKDSLANAMLSCV